MRHIHTAAPRDLSSHVVIADPAMVRLYELIDGLAVTTLPVILIAETGSGKELVATQVHARSPRAHRRMVTVNCAAIPPALAARELFGHVRGAFTDARDARMGLLEAASGSTLFLDEFGELPLDTQALLLRALETKRITPLGATHEIEVDVRFIAATNRDLDADMADGKFRRDLFYRLATAVLEIPPLRQRPVELRLLAIKFLEQACQNAGRPPMQIAASAMARLLEYAWPGNVRELKNVMEFLGTVVDGSELALAHVEPELARATVPAATRDATARCMRCAGELAMLREPATFRPLADELRALEETRIAEALEQTRYNKTAAARLLRMPYRTFHEKVKCLAGRGRLSTRARGTHS